MLKMQCKLVMLSALLTLMPWLSAAQAESLTVVGDENYPPYLFKDDDGNTVGYLVDLWDLWQQKTGVEVNLVPTAWVNAQARVLHGDADVIEMLYRTPKREALYIFSQPYAKQTVAIFNHESITGITSPRALTGFVVGVQKGDACIDKLEEHGIYSLRQYDNYTAMIEAALRQEIKLFCLDEIPANYYLYSLDRQHEFRKAFPLYTGEFHRAVRKENKTSMALVEKGMAAISPEEIKTLEKKWMGKPIETFHYSRELAYGILAASVAGIILLLWIALLRIAVHKKTREIETERTRLQDIIDGARAGTWEWNVQTGECLFNDRWASMLGYSLAELTPLTASTWKQLMHPDDLLLATEKLEHHFSGQTENYESDHRMRHKQERWIWVTSRGRLISRTEDGQPLLMRGTHIDITEKKTADELIWQQANFDNLTQLPNRHLFNARIEQHIKQARQEHGKLALISIDLDRFKEVNDSLGHSKGDDLLVAAGRRIQGCVRQSDTVARLGGDEFAIIVPQLADKAQLQLIADNLLDNLSRPYVLAEERVYISASIGISVYPDDASDSGEIMRNADQAMYEAKNKGRNRSMFFTQSMQDSAMQRMQLARDIRLAVERNELADYYQPIIELATGRVEKAEALLRWNHPLQGLVSPSVFIPVAEEIGAIVELGDWIFRRAAENVVKWQAIAGEDFSVSINKSPVQFQANTFEHSDWLNYLHTLGLTGRNIVVEITEGLLFNPERSIEDKLLNFRDAGIQVAIDDFGTGFSSLSYLNRFDIDYLKIDQSFTSQLAANNESYALCEAIIVMAHKLGLKVIAEGVETPLQRDLLLEIKCDFAQGYLYSPPVPAAAFQRYLEQSRQGQLQTAT